MELLTLCWKNFISAYLPAKEYRYVSMQPKLDGGRLERRETHDRGEKYTHRYTEKYTRKYKGKYNIQKLRKQTSEFQNRPLLILSDAEINKAIRKIFDPILVVVSNLCSTEEPSVLVCITPLRPALSFVHHRHFH